MGKCFDGNDKRRETRGREKAFDDESELSQNFESFRTFLSLKSPQKTKA